MNQTDIIAQWSAIYGLVFLTPVTPPLAKSAMDLPEWDSPTMAIAKAFARPCSVVEFADLILKRRVEL
jgi:hypothetical protein